MALDTPASSAPPLPPLAARGRRVALVSGDRRLTYAGLHRDTEAVAGALGSRKLVHVELANEVDAVVGYLGALQAGHAVLVTAPGAGSAAAAAFSPDASLVAASGWTPVVHHDTTEHDLHPDLALLLSTSGSTGSPKLVRLGADGVRANAEAVADSLGIGPEDVAPTALPLSYCYGLSVLHSHLARGGTVSVSDRSVLDPAFWDEFRAAGCTSLAGVPHTFDLLERVGFADLELPTLRTVTQAGGRLAPERVAALARLGASRGWRLFVMYGQTEATARMACLPPELATIRPDSVGRAVPGGSFELLDPDTEGVGELVYRGPNVMLGYAEQPADLALGRTVDRLHTGDLARLGDDGLVEIVGRTGRFVKPFGLRVDLARLEALLADRGIVAACTGDDRRLAVVHEGPLARGEVVDALQSVVALPAAAIVSRSVDSLPRLANGKVDLGSVAALSLEPDPTSGAAADDLRAVYRRVLGTDDVPDAGTFVGLGGDSLSYVEASVGVESVLGRLPRDWATTPVGILGEAGLHEERTRRRPGRATVETSLVLRAVGIVLVVANHAGLAAIGGGSHVLFAVAGANLARFGLAGGPHPRQLARATWRIAGPSVAWLALVVATTDDLRLSNVLLLDNRVDPSLGGGFRKYWFLEALVQVLAVATLLCLVPAIRRVAARRPGATAVVVLGAGLALRFGPLPLPDGPVNMMPESLLWLFGLGWASIHATSRWSRVTLTVLAALAVQGRFDDPERAALVLAGVLLLVWVPRMPMPRVAVPVLAALASASLHVYLTHYQVYPAVTERLGAAAAVVASLAVGIAAHRLTSGQIFSGRLISETRRPRRRRARTA